MTNILVSMAFYKSRSLSRSVCLLILSGLLQTACQPSKFSLDSTLIELHNQARKKGIKCSGSFFTLTAPKLIWSKSLALAAQMHSQEMFNQKYLSHINISHQNAGERILAVGYQWNSYAENLAVGVYDDASVFELWLNSPAHCKNIANQNYTEMGAAQVNGYWTALYAKPE